MSKHESEKKRFIETQLSTLISTADDRFCHCEYCTNGYKAFVLVHLRNGEGVYVRLTGDTYMSIICDVINALKRRSYDANICYS